MSAKILTYKDLTVAEVLQTRKSYEEAKEHYFEPEYQPELYAFRREAEKTIRFAKVGVQRRTPYFKVCPSVYRFPTIKEVFDAIHKNSDILKFQIDKEDDTVICVFNDGQKQIIDHHSLLNRDKCETDDDLKKVCKHQLNIGDPIRFIEDDHPMFKFGFVVEATNDSVKVMDSIGYKFTHTTENDIEFFEWERSDLKAEVFKAFEKSTPKKELDQNEIETGHFFKYPER